tara:strand:- start:383 stop:685 length:303 start_codon:yes stop_codon:yes gene_type:complete
MVSPKIEERDVMIFLLKEEIDNFDTFKSWFTNEAIPQIEAVGGKCLVMGVDVENENILHLVMDTPSVEVVQGFMGSDEFTEARKTAGVHVNTTQITFLNE